MPSGPSHVHPASAAGSGAGPWLRRTATLDRIDTTTRSDSISSAHSTPTTGAKPFAGGESCHSPDSFLPATTTPRRRDTSTVIGMISTSSPTSSNLGAGAEGGATRRSSPTPATHPHPPQPRTDIPFIGGGFSSASRATLTKRNVTPTAGSATWTARRSRSRLVGLLVALVLVWYIATSLTKAEIPRKKLSERWWEQLQDPLDPDALSALLPRPTVPARPPPQKPPPRPVSHSLAQIMKLSSTLSTSSPSFRSRADWTAIVHLSSTSQLLASHLHPLLESIAVQAPLPPARILLLCPSGMEPQPSVLSSFGSLVSILDYSPKQPPLLALATAANSHTITTDFVVFVDGHLPATSPLGKDYVKVLLHAFGTKEYGASIVSAGGLALASSPSNRRDECVYPHQGGKGSVSRRISVPSTPFLFPTSWLLPRAHTPAPTAVSTPSEPVAITSTSPTILQGLSTALPLEIGLAFALWTKSSIPVNALPLPLSSSALDTAGVDGWSCQRLERNLQSVPDASVRDAVRVGFSIETGAGDGLRKIKGDRTKGGIAPSKPHTKLDSHAAHRANEMRKGSFVLLLSGRDELDAVRKIACRFANGVDLSDAIDFSRDGEADGIADRELRIVVADWNSQDQALEDQAHEECHLEIIPLLGSTSAAAPDTSISLPLIDMLDTTLDPAPAVVLYLSDGPRAREFEEVLKWMGGVFGVSKGGERLSRIRMEKELIGTGGQDDGKGKMTVVGIEREEVQRAEWIGALPIEALRHWHTPRIDVSVITNDRPVSLHRLLLSLRSAHYFGDDVSLALNLEQTADRLTQRLVDDFRWNQGPLNLRHRILLGGLMPAIVESWYPASNDTYGVLLEDDVEVSPLFYGWLKFTILKYRYTAAGRAASSRLFGISLYQQKNIELRPEGRQPFDAHKLFDSLSLHPTTPYLSQIPCSWGAAYFPEHWREFHSYLSLRLSEIALPISEPIVPAIRSNRWPRSWKKYFIELVYLRGYTMLYPNYPGFESLSTNHLEKGTHVKTSQVEEKKKVLFEVPLLDVEGSLVDSLPAGQLPEWGSMPIMDLWGSLASNEDLIERGWQTTRQIGSCATLPDLDVPKLRHDARELLCRKEWDRETQGKLVQAQPLQARVPSDAELDQGRLEAAKAEKVTNSDEGGDPAQAKVRQVKMKRP
ncbi:uncharacterized protein JCM15063_003019 [Sporobolomyces koalae]|uniref:uncharacterized protein n=1 Tax=Sporobolomyces koalae TaxID=500713 RepID=UPI003171DF33